MSQQPPDDARTEAAVWQAMVLFSTLSTTVDVWHTLQERRAGRDPSEQEDAEIVQPYLYYAAGELQAWLMQLQASRLQADRDDKGYIAALVRRYNELMTLRRIEQELHVVHQRLLSLYPTVSEAMIEETRLLHRESRALLSGRAWEDVPLFLNRGLIFTSRLFAASGR